MNSIEEYGRMSYEKIFSGDRMLRKARTNTRGGCRQKNQTVVLVNLALPATENVCVQVV